MIKKEYIKPESFVVVIPANKLILMISANGAINNTYIGFEGSFSEEDVDEGN